MYKVLFVEEHIKANAYTSDEGLTVIQNLKIINQTKNEINMKKVLPPLIHSNLLINQTTQYSSPFSDTFLFYN